MKTTRKPVAQHQVPKYGWKHFFENPPLTILSFLWERPYSDPIPQEWRKPLPPTRPARLFELAIETLFLYRYEREHDHWRRLHGELFLRHQAASRINDTLALDTVIPDGLPWPKSELTRLVRELAQTGTLREPPQIDWWRARADTHHPECGEQDNEYRKQSLELVTQYARYLDGVEQWPALFSEGVEQALNVITRQLPQLGDGSAFLQLPIAPLINDLPNTIERLMRFFEQKRFVEAGLFTDIREQFLRNRQAAAPESMHKARADAIDAVLNQNERNGEKYRREHDKYRRELASWYRRNEKNPDSYNPEPEEPREPIYHELPDLPDPELWPSQANLPVRELVETFCQGTPFVDLLNDPTPISIPDDTLFSHMWIVAQSGAGKTTLLGMLAHHFITEARRPSLVVFDSQGKGSIVDKLAHLKQWYGSDRCILVNPRDMERAAAVNLFDIGLNTVGACDDATREELINGALNTLVYCFSILGVDVTGKQETPLRYIGRLLCTTFPEVRGRNATISDMVELLDNPKAFADVIQAIPPKQAQVRSFFETSFTSGTYKDTSQQIRGRLDKLLENDTMRRLLNAPRSSFDLFDELQNKGSVILIDTSGDGMLDDEYAGHYGRVWMSLVYRAILKRRIIDEDKRHPTFLMIDEFWQYMENSKVEQMVAQLRKFHCGCIFAHQLLGQASPALQAALKTNTRIKMVANLSQNDQRVMAPEMRTTPDFIQHLPDYHFATYITKITPTALAAPVLQVIDTMPRMSQSEYEAWREKNRARVAVTMPEPPEPPQDPEHADEPLVSPHAGKAEEAPSVKASVQREEKKKARRTAKKKEKTIDPFDADEV